MNRRQFICSAVANVVAIRTVPAWASQLEMTVYKDPNCGCCKAWAQAMQNADFAVTIRDMDDLSSIKTKYGVPAAMQGATQLLSDRISLKAMCLWRRSRSC